MLRDSTPNPFRSMVPSTKPCRRYTTNATNAAKRVPYRNTATPSQDRGGRSAAFVMRLPWSHGKLALRKGASAASGYLWFTSPQSGLGGSGKTTKRRPAKFNTNPTAVANTLAISADRPMATKKRVEYKSTTLTTPTTNKNNAISVTDRHFASRRNRISTER